MGYFAADLLSRLRALATSLPVSSTLSILPRTILVVEDDPAVTEFLSETLCDVGFRVLIAENGEEGIAAFSRAPGEICCIILDFSLPGMHAARVLSKFREMNSSVKVLLASGYPLGQIDQELPLNRVDGFIVKPFDIPLLLTELEKLLG